MLNSTGLAQVAKFLFVPETMLAAAFLIVFIALLAFGVWLFVRCRSRLQTFDANAEEQFDAVSNKLSPETFIRKNIEKLSALEGIMEGLPDTLVSVGILATFIGLGVAIQDAADLLSSDTFELDKLISLLGVIAFKFQTSVWGIFFSLVFRRFAVENYFAYRQDVIDNVRDRLYERERDGIRTLLEKQNIFLEDQLQYQKSIDSQRRESFEQFRAELKIDRQNQLDRIVEALTNNTSLILDANQESMHQRDNLNAALVDALNKNHKELSAIIVTVANKLQGALVNTLAKNHNALVELLAKNHNALVAKYDELTVKIDRSVAEYVKTSREFTDAAQTFVRSTEVFNGHVDSYRSTVEESFAKLITAHTEISEKQYDTLLTTKRTVQDIMKVYIRSEQQFTQHVDELQQVFLRSETQYVAELRNKLETVLNATLDKFSAALGTGIKQVQDDYRASSQQAHADYADIISKLRNDHNEIVKGVSEFYAREVNHFANVTNDLSSTLTNVGGIIDGFNASSRTQLDNMSATYSEMQSLIDNMNKSSREALSTQNENLRQFTNSFLSSVNAVEQQQRQEFETRTAKLNAALEALKQLAVATTDKQAQVSVDMQEFQREILAQNVEHNEEAMKILSAMSVDRSEEFFRRLTSQLASQHVESMQSLSNLKQALIDLKGSMPKTIAVTQTPSQPPQVSLMKKNPRDRSRR